MELQATLQPMLDKLQGWFDGAIAILPNLVVAAIVVAAFIGLARVARKAMLGLSERLDVSVAISRLTATLTQYAIIFAGLLIALGIVGLQKAVLSILAGAGVVGLAIGFAFQDLAANFIAGVAMGFRKPFKIGDIVQTADHTGEVEAIDLRNTVIRSFDGRRVIIPNRDVFEQPLINFNANGKRRVEVTVGVAYDTELAEATRIAREAVEGLAARHPDTDVQVLAYEFGGSSINFRVRFWVAYPDESFVAAQHDAVLAIKKAFDAHDIGIPFPIRTLDLSGVRGTLRPMLVDPRSVGGSHEATETSEAAAA